MRAKLFRNGRSQAVRLPASCRFEGTEVEVQRDEHSGVVTLTPIRSTPQEWLRRRSELLESDPEGSFEPLFNAIDRSEAAQERDWP
jgi:antitoxin VapB